MQCYNVNQSRRVQHTMITDKGGYRGDVRAEGIGQLFVLLIRQTEVGKNKFR